MNARTVRLATAALAASTGLAVLAPGAGAVTTSQVVTAAIGESIIATVSNATVNFGTIGVGANVVPTATAGTLRVQANVLYTVTVQGLKPTMTQYVDNGYVAGTAMASPLLVTTTASGVTGAVPVSAAVITDTAPTLVATGTGLLSNDHTYNLSFAQTVAPTDAKTTYRNDLTYTTSGPV